MATEETTATGTPVSGGSSAVAPAPTHGATPGGGRPRVVIIGGGFGGMSAAQALAKAPVDVTIIDRTNHHLFQPMLYQLATGIVSDGEIAAPLRGIFAKQANAETRLAEVTDINLEHRTVSAQAPDGDRLELSYDHLIIAAGAAPAYFGHDEWAQHASGLKSLEDAHRLRAQILGAFEMAADAQDEAERERWLTFVTVGAGPTGVEITGQIAELSRHLLRREFHSVDTERAKVILADGGDAVLGPFAERLQKAARRDLESMGVEIALKAKVTGIDDHGVDLENDDGSQRRIDAGTVIWAAGVHASGLGEMVAKQSDAESGHGGRVKVDEHCAIPGHPEVFVIGDMAEIDGVPGVAQPAMQEGRHAAKVIAARVGGKSEPGAFKYFDKGSLATVGHSKAVADAFGIKLSGRPAMLIWGVVHLAYLVGWGNRFGTATRWGWTLLTRGRRELAIISTAGLSAGSNEPAPIAPAQTTQTKE